jgi:drug/metabolite transporter (DMT)-like permease
MLASFLTTIFFSLSVIFAARSARLLGAGVANLCRILLAAVFLGIWAHVYGAGLRGPAFPWFFASGVIGFGLGDMALFGALPRIGPRLSILLTQCLAAPIAAVVEYAWLGTKMSAGEAACAAVILAGVVVALAPDRGAEGGRRVFWIGVLFGIGSAMGQAFGAVISRKANAVAALAHFEIDGGTAAYQRIIGGILMTLPCLWLVRRMQGVEPLQEHAWRRGWPFVVGNALAGPTIGVGCYQWALKTAPSGIVLPIVATSPLVTILLAFFIEGTRPSRRAVWGGVLAVAGAAALNAVQARH